MSIGGSVTLIKTPFLRLFVEETDSWPFGFAIDVVAGEYAIALGPVAVILEVGRE